MGLPLASAIQHCISNPTEALHQNLPVFNFPSFRHAKPNSCAATFTRGCFGASQVAERTVKCTQLPVLAGLAMIMLPIGQQYTLTFPCQSQRNAETGLELARFYAGQNCFRVS